MQKDRKFRKIGFAFKTMDFPLSLSRFALFFGLFSHPFFALAGGLEVPDLGTRAIARGGAFVAKADDATAVYHNPGAVARLRGLHLAYNHNLIWSHSAFTRSPTSLPVTDMPSEDPLKKSENLDELFALGAFVAATYDFGLENWGFGLSVFGPPGTGHERFSRLGGQRYMLTEFDAALVYYNATVSYASRAFGVGVTFQYADLWYLKDSLATDGTPGGPLNPYASALDVEGTISLEDRFAFSAILGLWWRPCERLELALSGRAIPVFLHPEGSFSLKNLPDGTPFTAEQLEVKDARVRMDLTLPPTAHLGARFEFGDSADLELDLTYEAWSIVDSFDLDVDGQIVLLANEPTQDMRIDKHWKDVFSARLGGSVQLNDAFELSAGGFLESGAVPNAYSHLDLPSFGRLGLNLGFRWRFLSRFDLNLAYSHIFQEDREVSESEGKVFQQRPIGQCPGECGGLSGVPVNAGKFETSYDLLSFGLEWHP